MTKNLYYQHVVKRSNAVQSGIFNLVFSASIFSRLLLEVFIKRNFGERYFSMGMAFWNFLVMLILPIPFFQFSEAVYRSSWDHFISINNSGLRFIFHYLTWYGFTFAFGIVCLFRQAEIQHQPSVFDFERYSLDNGRLLPYFQRLIKKRSQNIRQQEIIYEPLPFLLVGIPLVILQQHIGWMLIFCSGFYALSYICAYHIGDHFVMDKIDEMILNEELEKAFVENEDPSNTRGVRFYARKPTSEEMRRKVADSFIEHDEEVVSEAI